jgi:hypothetical protein
LNDEKIKFLFFLFSFAHLKYALLSSHRNRREEEHSLTKKKESIQHWRERERKREGHARSFLRWRQTNQPVFRAQTSTTSRELRQQLENGRGNNEYFQWETTTTMYSQILGKKIQMVATMKVDDDDGWISTQQTSKQATKIRLQTTRATKRQAPQLQLRLTLICRC